MTDARSTTPQSWQPEDYRRHAGFVSALGLPVLDLLAPQPGEAILDLGCGEGTLMERLRDLGCRVTGVDASPQQIAAAQARGLDARVADAHALPFAGAFDAVFSNAALHWMLDPDAVIAGVARALKPGGRFVGEMGGAGNVAAVVTALVDALDRRGLDGRAAVPWYFPTPAEYRARLEHAGFTVTTIELFPRPTPLPTGLRGWLATFAQAFTARLPAADHDAFLAEVEAAAAPALRGADGGWSADYVRLRFAAHRS